MNMTKLGDQLAIAGALLCTAHCLLTPVLLILIPSMQALQFLADESLHRWILLGVLPISFVALTMGCRKHRKSIYLVTGGLGLLVLLGAAFFGHDLVGEAGEKVLTVLGSLILSHAHYKNFMICKVNNCATDSAVSNKHYAET